MNETIKRNEQVAEEFFRLCNIMGNEGRLAEALTNQLSKEHRTIIQSSMGVLKDLIKFYAENSGSDLRNKASLEWAKKVAELDGHFPYI